MELLARLDARESALLTHAFACPGCGESAIGRMVDRYGLELLLQEVYAPPVVEASAAMQLAERSLEEREIDVVEGRAKGADILRLALVASREEQLGNPLEAARLANWAASRLGWVGSEREALAIACEAAELALNATRLAGKPARGDKQPLFEAFREVPPGVSARFARAKGLCLWAVGAHEGAGEALSHATSLFLEAGEHGEEGTTLVLEGLLRVDQGAEFEGSLLLVGGLAAMERGRRPWLEVRALLSLALARCRHERRASGGRAILEHVHRTYSGAETSSDAIEVLWSEGRIYGASGQQRQAIAHLDEARRLALDEGRLGELTLITHDLHLQRVLEGQFEDLRERADEVAALWERAGLPAGAVREGLGGWFVDSESLHECHYFAQITLRKWIKSPDGPGLRPLPFV
jgi:tetratricopeptide (TPR) repeat protein